MKRYGWLITLLLSLQMSGQRVVRFSSVETFTEEFLELIKLSKEDKILFSDSLLPNIQYALDKEIYGQWITLCNNMLRKRITEPTLWEELFRITENISSYEDYGTLKKCSYILIHSLNPIPLHVARHIFLSYMRISSIDRSMMTIPYLEGTLQ